MLLTMPGLGEDLMGSSRHHMLYKWPSHCVPAHLLSVELGRRCWDSASTRPDRVSAGRWEGNWASGVAGAQGTQVTVLRVRQVHFLPGVCALRAGWFHASPW